MIIHYHTTLAELDPEVEFSFVPNGTRYILKLKRWSGRSKMYYVIVRKKGERKTIRKKFTMKQLYRTIVYLHNRKSSQPEYTISKTYICLS